MASIRPFAAQPPVKCNLLSVSSFIFEYFKPEFTTSTFKDLKLGISNSLTILLSGNP